MLKEQVGLLPTPNSNAYKVGEKFVITDGYMPKEAQIASYKAAGQKLVDWREMMFPNGVPRDWDGEPLTEEDEIVITARHDFDFHDAHLEVLAIEEKIRRQKNELRRRKEAAKDTLDVASTNNTASDTAVQEARSKDQPDPSKAS